MALNAITTIARPRSRDDIGAFADGDAWLAGGTWLFSEPQPRLRRLIDLSTLEWAPLRVSDARLHVAATCTVATLNAFEAPASWTAPEDGGYDLLVGAAEFGNGTTTVHA